MTIKEVFADAIGQKKYVLGLTFWLIGSVIFLAMLYFKIPATFTEYALFTGGLYAAITAANSVDKALSPGPGDPK